MGTIQPELAENMESLPELFKSILSDIKKDTDLENFIVSIEKAKWQYFIELVRKNKFMFDFIQTLIDLVNLKTFIQVKFLQLQKDMLDMRIISEGRLKLDTFKNYYDQPWESFFSYLHVTDYGWLNEIPQKDKLWIFDKLCDDFVVDYLQNKSRNAFFSMEPLINYIFLKKQETKMLRTIWIGKISNISKDNIKQLLGKTYN